jgi:hypothetical protein
MTIVEFLNARLDEDEATTRRQDQRWYVCDDGHVATPTAQRVDGTDHLPNHHNTWAVMYDPERVRADIAAKRAIVYQYVLLRPFDWPKAFVETLELNLHAIASVYADHPDYNPEWRL